MFSGMRTRDALLPPLLLAVTCMLGCASPGPTVSPPLDAGAVAVVEELYDRVTFGPGTLPDWDAVRALFVEEAVIVLRTGREAMTVFSLEGFVDDFVRFIEQAGVERTGFRERVLDVDGWSHRDIAHVRVRFDSWIPGSGREPGEGLDSFELVRREDRWKIVSIVNERPTPDEPIPAALFRGCGAGTDAP